MSWLLTFKDHKATPSESPCLRAYPNSGAALLGSKEHVLNRGPLFHSAHSEQHHITYPGLKQCERGQTGPCQSTEFQHIRALLLDMAGLNIP